MNLTNAEWAALMDQLEWADENNAELIEEGRLKFETELEREEFLEEVAALKRVIQKFYAAKEELLR